MALLKPKQWYFLSGLLLAALMAGCTTVAPVAETGAAAGDEAASGEKTRLVLAQSVDVQGLEPSNVNSRAESNIFGHIYAQLYEITESGTLDPYLAESYTLSEDGKEMTFTLKEGLTCHDGEALTAEDVAYTFTRAADDANGFTGNTAGFVLDAIKFLDARVDSDLEVTIVMDHYTSPALGLIAEAYIHCKDSYEAMSLEEAAANPIGSGPYRFVEWVKDDYVLLEKVADYSLKDVFYDELEWKVIPEASTRTAELIAGNVDIITNVPPDQHGAVNSSDTASIAGVAGTRRMYIGYNLGDTFAETEGGQIIANKDVRIALQYAIDVPTICQTLLGTECERASSMVNAPNNNPNLTAYPYDPAKAEELLDAAGYPRGEDGTRFTLGFMAGKGRYLNDISVVPALAQYLSDVGVNVELTQMEWGSEFVPLLRAHEVGPLFFVGTGGATWNAVYDLSDISAPDAATNYTEWNNEEWFALWDSLANVRDAAAEREITDKLQEVMYNDPPWLFLYFQPDFYGVGNSVDWSPRRDEILDVNTATAK